MNFLKFIAKLLLAFLAFGAAASLYLSEKRKNDYIHFEDPEDTGLY